MYVCLDCGEFFEDPAGSDEEGFRCPHCNRDEFEEAARCNHCAKDCYETKDGLCEDCWREAYGE